MRPDVSKELALLEQSVTFLAAFVGVLSSANGGDSRDGPAVSGLELLQETEVPEMLRYLLKALVRKPV